MKSIEENIEELSHAMQNEAKAEAEQIKTEAQAKADAILQRARTQAAAERAEILDKANQEADRLRGQVIATTQMKARTMELDHREKLLQNVFSTALQQLSAVGQYSNYEEIALRLVREGMLQLNAKKLKIRADAQTEKYLTSAALEKLSQEFKIQLTLEKTLEHGTGVILETADGHLQYDNTLETRLARLQNNLRSPVYRLLIGEQL